MTHRFNFLGTWSSAGAASYSVRSDDVPVNIVSRISTLLPEYKDETNNLGTLDSGVSINKVILTSGDAQIWVSFVDENAGYNSSMGYYIYPLRGGLKVPNTSDGSGGYVALTGTQIKTNTTDITFNIIFPRVKKVSRKGPLNVGDKVQLMFNFAGATPTSTFPTGYGVGFFLIPDGWSLNWNSLLRNGIIYPNASVDKNNSGYNISGASSIMYSQSMLNTGGLTQCILLQDYKETSSDGTSSFYMSFEDIMRINGAGDDDFNDVIFKVTYTPSTNCKIDYPEGSMLQSVPEPINNTNSNILFAADSSGMFFWPNSSNYLKMKNDWTTNGNIDLIHTISANTKEYAASLYDIFKGIKWNTISSNGSRGTLSSVSISYDDDKTITNTYKTNKSKISERMYLYLSDDNQTQMYNNRGTMIKNIVMFQTNYIFAKQSHPGTTLSETHTALDTTSNKSVNATGSISAINFSSTTAQGDPYIRTIHGINYKLPDKTGYVKLYDNGELIINAHVAKYEPYSDHNLALLREATFVHKTSLILLDKNRNVKQHVVVDNLTLEIIDSNLQDTSIYMTKINDSDPLFHSKFTNVPQKNYNYRFSVISTDNLGDILVRFIRYNEEDLLTGTDMMDNASMLMSDAIGAFISSKNIRWVDGLLDVSV